MYRNPFILEWSKGQFFLSFQRGGELQKLKKKVLVYLLQKKFRLGELPLESAERLVSKDQRIRESRYYSWIIIINDKSKLSSPSITKVIC